MPTSDAKTEDDRAQMWTHRAPEAVEALPSRLSAVIRGYSDAMLMHLLRTHCPEKYGDRQPVKEKEPGP
jgi:hypothetical protein